MKSNLTKKTAGIILVCIVSLISLFFLGKFDNLPEITLTKNLPKGKLHREYIFNKESTTKELHEIFSYSSNSGKIKVKVLENKLNEILVPYIKKEIIKFLQKSGKNWQELKGKIYYEIKSKSIELYVLWKNSIYDNNYINFDKLELVFS